MTDDLTRANALIDLPALIGEFYPASGARAGKASSIRAAWRDDKNPSASVYQHQGVWFWKDHGTGATGNAWGFLVDVCKFSKIGAAEEVKRRAGIATTNNAPHTWTPNPYKPAKQPVHKPPLEPLADNWFEFLHDARERLDTTDKAIKPLEWYGLSKAQAQQIGLGLDIDGGLIIPIYDTRLELVALKKRFAKKDAKPKYTYITTGRGAPAWVGGNIEADTKLFVVVEGEMNAVCLHLMLEEAQVQAGVLGIAGAEGSADPLAPILRGKDVLIYADGDDAGKRARQKWEQQIKSAGARVVAQIPTLEGSEDFADLHKQLGTYRGATVCEQLVLDGEELLRPTETDSTADALGAKPLDLENPVPEVEWLVQDMFPKFRVSIIAAFGGVGKSSLMAHLAACINQGRQWLGFNTTQSDVLVVDYEDEVNTFRRWAVRVQNGLGVKLDTSKLKHIEVGSSSQWLGHGFPSMVDTLLQHLKTHTVIVVDAFESAMQIDSNKAPEVLYAMAALNKLARAGHTVLVLDHLPKTGKGQSKADAMPSGSVQKTNQSRAVVILEDVTPEGSAKSESILKMRCVKNNLAKKFDPFGISRQIKDNKAVFDVTDLPELDSSAGINPPSRAESEIVQILEGRGVVTLAEICRSVTVSDTVLRRRLQQMEREGKIQMTSGNPTAYRLVASENKSPLGVGERRRSDS